ncbi:MAG: nucleotidyltransferase domain-containing protein [Verrucomicrobia bacterium]|nr:nucleotidyltransferase domain-containing protein [Verrucomicrobiota bacterium]
MKTLAPTLLDEVVERLAAEFTPEQIILFGSHAWGTPTDDSDLDLFVVVSDSDESSYRRDIRARRCLHGMGLAKDVLVRTRAETERYRGVVASLEHKIFTEGRILYERS